jgi:hypothetical protein
MLELGILARDEFRAKWMNEGLKTAQSALSSPAPNDQPEIPGEAPP